MVCEFSVTWFFSLGSLYRREHQNSSRSKEVGEIYSWKSFLFYWKYVMLIRMEHLILKSYKRDSKKFWPLYVVCTLYFLWFFWHGVRKGTTYAAVIIWTDWCEPIIIYDSRCSCNSWDLGCCSPYTRSYCSQSLQM